MKLVAGTKHLTELANRGYSVEQVCLLKLIDDGDDIKEMIDSSAKWAAVYQSAIRKGLIFEENKLTTDGKEIIIFIDSKEGKRIKKVAAQSTEFDLFWNEFPKTDTFEYKGRKFTGSRGLRTARDDCRTKFSKIILEGEVTATQLVEALKLDVHQKKEMSYKTGTNKLSFMQNSLTYLNQRSYDPFIDLLSQGVTIQETLKTNSGGTDI